MELSESKRTRRLICLALALATLGAYARVVGFEFVNFDDPDYVTQNPMVKGGLTSKGMIWAFTHTYASNWHPVTWISHMVDCGIFGMRAGGPHVLNVVLHAANVVLLFLFLQRITGAQWRCATVAALFAVHPLHVESVAWISERKDVLSTLFALLALLAYVRYVKESEVQGRRSKAWFVLALGLFALGLMAKPMLVTLPFVMLLLDFWPLERHSQANKPEAAVTKERPRPAISRHNEGWTAKLLVLEKIPFIVLSTASSAITIYAQKTGGAMATLKNLPLNSRIFSAFEAWWWYVQKTFWPVHLAMFYPMQTHRPMLPFIGKCLILLAISVGVIRMAKRYPFLLVGWLWFSGVLVPVIGLVQVGAQEVADRYSYIPSIGLFIALVWSIYEWVKRSRKRLIAVAGVVGVTLALLAAATIKQSGYWKNSVALCQHAIEVTHDNDTAFNDLGVALYDQGRYEEALDAYNSALEIRPAGELYKNIGMVFDKTGKPDEALAQYERAVELDPENADLEHWLATALRKRGRRDEALAHHEAAAKLNPGNAGYQNDLGAALARAGRIADALAHYAEAVRLEPDNPQFQNNFASALERSGQMNAADEHYQMAIRDDPKFFQAYSNLSVLRAGSPLSNTNMPDK